MRSPAGAELNRTGLSGRAVAFARLDRRAPLAGLRADVASLLQENWISHVNRRDYRGGWDVLPLRCQRQHAAAHPVLQGFSIEAGEEWRDLPKLQKCPAIGAVLGGLGCPLKAVRLMRLHAGAAIKPHRDSGLSIEYGEARLHLPVDYSNEILFNVDHQPVPMHAGELWYVNVDREHEVCNNGDADRVNLVIDCVVNDWLREQIRSAPALFYCGSETSKL